MTWLQKHTAVVHTFPAFKLFKAAEERADVGFPHLPRNKRTGKEFIPVHCIIISYNTTSHFIYSSTYFFFPTLVLLHYVQ